LLSLDYAAAWQVLLRQEMNSSNSSSSRDKLRVKFSLLINHPKQKSRLVPSYARTVRTLKPFVYQPCLLDLQLLSRAQCAGDVSRSKRMAMKTGRKMSHYPAITSREFCQLPKRLMQYS